MTWKNTHSQLRGKAGAFEQGNHQSMLDTDPTRLELNTPVLWDHLRKIFLLFCFFMTLENLWGQDGR